MRLSASFIGLSLFLALPVAVSAAASSTASSTPAQAPEASSSSPIVPPVATSTDILQLLLQLKGIGGGASGGGGGNSAASGTANPGTAGASASPSSSRSAAATAGAGAASTSSQASLSSSSSGSDAGGGAPEYVPLIQVIPRTQLSWATAEPSDTEVYYSIVPPINVDHAQSVTDSATSTSHAATLQNLISDTTYHVLELSKTPEGRTVYARELEIRLP